MDEQELVREAMRAIGRRTSERKAQAARENGRKTFFTEETRAKLRAAQQARRERERQERAALGSVETEPKEKKRPARPRTRPAEEGPKRPRGRPKEDAQNSTLDA